MSSYPSPLRRAGLGMIALLAAGFLAASLPTSRAATPLPSAEDFFRPQAISLAQLNEAGTHLALLVYDAKTDSNGLRVIDLGAKKAVDLAGNQAYDIRTFRWLTDERLVFTLARDNLYAGGLYVVSRDLSSLPSILNEQDWVEVISIPDARPNNVIVWVRGSARLGRVADIVEVAARGGRGNGFDVDESGVVEIIAPPKLDEVLGWLPDRTGEIRYVAGAIGHVVSLYRRDRGTWTRLDLDCEKNLPIAVDADPAVLWVARETPAGLRELVRWNSQDNSFGPVIYHDPKYDFSRANLHFAGNRRDLLGFTYSRQGPTQVWLDDRDVAVKKSIDEALPPNRTNLVISRSKDNSRLLVRSSADRHPGTLYLFDRKTGDLTPVGDYAPQLAGRSLAEVKTMAFKARDGLVLDGYVTVPAGFVVGKPGAMVVLPHGGPWVRDFWGYNPEAQFLASRGYLVFQPNYRGSSGYSSDISRKPRMDFRKMHEDVTDAVQSLVRSNIADPKHIAIMGGSFGGYLAISGAAFEPELYRCAITQAGVFDWERLMRADKTDHPYVYHEFMRSLGDAPSRAQKFEAMSPLYSADRIKIPVFVAHGGDDQRVADSQSRRLVTALKKNHVPVETMFETWEGHGFYTLKNRVELYERIEAFLKKNL